MNILSKFFGNPNEQTIRSLEPLVGEINAKGEELDNLSDDEIRLRSEKLKELARGITDREEEKSRLDEILPEAFALAREASFRVLGKGRKIIDKQTGKETKFMAHFDVQLMGGIVLHRGQIAEMRTGEGKTLVATLPLYLNGLTGRGVHLVTVNDYLSRVGAGWNAPLYHFLGLSTSVVTHAAAYLYDTEYSDETQYDERLKHLKPVDKKVAYAADIIYGTNNEFGFDYLRDNMVSSVQECSQRELFFAIVDEVDSILIDEARTPLIISAQAEESTDKYYRFAELVGRLVVDEDYNVDEKMRASTLTEAGIAKMEKWLNVENIYTTGGISEVHHIEQALKAFVLFKRDKDYVVKEGEVIIVDEFTGRLMPGRRYSEGLHQAIEAKEGVKIQRESQTLATVTFQNLFRLYRKLAGMTGTAVTEAEEFAKIYNLDTVVIPTNAPMVRKDENDLVYKTEDAKYAAVVEEIKRKREIGQPVLVGTISIEKNEYLADMLARAGIEANVLNAKNHEKEAQFIAQAGRLGGVTIATNMAGRGVDIILGGNPPEGDEQEKVKAAGGLFVIGTERHESRRIDNQLRGRAGRQGDPGGSRFFVSLEDDLMRIFGGDRMKNMMNTLKVPDDMPIENKLISKSIESAQKKVEGHNFDTRKHLVEYDDVINKHREAIYKRRREILELAEELSDDAQIDEVEGEKNSKSEITNSKQYQNSKLKIQNEENETGEINNSPRTLSDIILEMVERELENVVTFHTAGDNGGDWNPKEIMEVVKTIYPVGSEFADNLVCASEESDKLDKVEARTKMIECLAAESRKRYEELKSAAEGAGINWKEVEKQVLIRAMDTMWIEHLEAIDYLRRGIGLRGYGQRDPLVEYKKEAYRMFSELTNLIQQQVVYTIYKVGDIGGQLAPAINERAVIYSAPAKTMDERDSAFDGESGKKIQSAPVISKQRNEAGEKIGRNDPCPCGAKKPDGTPIKYKHCHGK
jgi:preprotein translocase subunit SecA